MTCNHDGSVLSTTPLRRRNTWILNKDWVCGDYVVPRGYVTDLDSIPNVPIAYTLFKGYARESAVLHDWLYFTGIVSRKKADELFYHHMVEIERVSPIIAKAMYIGVRVGGGNGFRHARNKYGVLNMSIDSKRVQDALSRRRESYADALNGVNY